MPRVLNKSTDNIPQDSVYVGQGSSFSNPYKEGVDGTKEEILERYKIYIYSSILPSSFELLRDKDLVFESEEFRPEANFLLELAAMPLEK